MSVSFKKPPINEVALGYTFLGRPDLLIPHLGRFWAELEGAYPNCQHAAPILDDSEQVSFTELLLPRIWFTSADSSKLVQLQQDRLIFNWREVGLGEPYCRFPAIRAEFHRVRKLFEDYVARVTGIPILPAGYNLTYVNVIKVGDGAKLFQNIGMVFPDFAWNGRPGRFLPPPSSLGWSGTFSLPDNFGTFVAEIQPGKLTKTNEPIIKFELRAGSGSLGGKTIDFDQWIDVAHTWVIHAFKDLTSEEMQSKVWFLENEDQ